MVLNLTEREYKIWVTTVEERTEFLKAVDEAGYKWANFDRVTGLTSTQRELPMAFYLTQRRTPRQGYFMTFDSSPLEDKLNYFNSHDAVELQVNPIWCE